MIKRTFEYYCDNISKVENYEQAKADDFKGWDCHHRLELIATGGVCDVDRQDLIDWGIYYHRPADELIFLKASEHMSLHNKGKNMSEDFKKKVSETLKGHSVSEESRKKMSKSHKGKHNSEEHNQKISESNKGKKHTMNKTHWKLVNGKRVWY